MSLFVHLLHLIVTGSRSMKVTVKTSAMTAFRTPLYLTFLGGECGVDFVKRVLEMVIGNVSILVTDL
jgi:hypothetical protein